MLRYDAKCGKSNGCCLPNNNSVAYFRYFMVLALLVRMASDRQALQEDAKDSKLEAEV